MSWLNPEPGDETEPPVHDETGDEEEEVSDPLEGYEDEERTRIEAVIAAREEAARAEAMNQYRAGNGRWGNAANQLREAGLVVDEHGNVAPQDRAKVIAWLGIESPTDPAVKPEAVEEEWPDPTYDPKGFRARMLQEVDRMAEAKAEARMAPILSALQVQAVPVAQQQARAVLETDGRGYLADDPNFQQAFNASLTNLPLDMRTTAKGVRAATYFAMGMMDELPPPPETPRVERTAADRAAYAAQLHRNAAASTTPPRGTGRVSEPAQYSQQVQEFARASNMTAAEYEAMGSPETAAVYFEEQRRKAASRRGNR